jgi:hypothetical protein
MMNRSGATVRPLCIKQYALVRRPTRFAGLAVLAITVATSLTACGVSNGHVDARCAVTVRASPIRFPVAEITRDNLGDLTQRFHAVVTLDGKPSPGNQVRFYLGKDADGGPVGGGRSDARGEVSTPVVEHFTGYLPPLYQLNEATSYVAMVDFAICSDVESAPAPIRFAGGLNESQGSESA